MYYLWAIYFHWKYNFKKLFFDMGDLYDPSAEVIAPSTIFVNQKSCVCEMRRELFYFIIKILKFYILWKFLVVKYNFTFYFLRNWRLCQKCRWVTPCPDHSTSSGLYLRYLSWKDFSGSKKEIDIFRMACNVKTTVSFSTSCPARSVQKILG